MKTSLSRTLFPILVIALLQLSCKSVVIVNSDIREETVEPVKLGDYTSMQKRDPSMQDPTLAIGVSISGGGSRAQYFGLGVLMGLEEIKPAHNSNGKRNLLEDIDYFSTVSGGGFAAGYFLTVKKNELAKTGQSFRNYWLSKTHADSYSEKIKYDAKIGSFIGSGFNKYERSRKKPSFPDRIDRQLLQVGKALPGSTKKIEPITLGDVFKTDGNIPQLPMLVANGTIFNNAERIPFMPHIIADLDITASRMPKEPLVSPNARYNNGFTLPLRYAIAASSAFPGLVPQVKFIAQPREGTSMLKNYNPDKRPHYIRVVDGGVVDNLGYTTLIELLGNDQVSAPRKRAIIIDCSGVGNEERYAADTLRKSDVLTRSLFFTLQSKYKTFEDDIKKLFVKYNIPDTNYLKIGITTLRETAQRIVDTINTVQREKHITPDMYQQKSRPTAPAIETGEAVTLTDISILDSLRLAAGKKLTLRDRNNRWDKFYGKFEYLVNDRIKKYNLTLEPVEAGVQVNNIDRLKFSDFDKFGRDDKVLLVLLYELASLVETNIKIRSEQERSILVLAGRYSVYLNKKQLNWLYNN